MLVEFHYHLFIILFIFIFINLHVYKKFIILYFYDLIRV